MLKALYDKLDLQSKTDFETFKTDITDNPAMQEAIYNKLDLKSSGVQLNTFKTDLGVSTLSNNQRNLLDTVADKESNDYNAIVDGGRFDDYSSFHQDMYHNLLDYFIPKFLLVIIGSILIYYITYKLGSYLKLSTRNFIYKILFLLFLSAFICLGVLSMVIYLSGDTKFFNQRMGLFLAAYLMAMYYGYKSIKDNGVHPKIVNSTKSNLKNSKNMLEWISNFVCFRYSICKKLFSEGTRRLIFIGSLVLPILIPNLLDSANFFDHSKNYWYSIYILYFSIHILIYLWNYISDGYKQS